MPIKIKLIWYEYVLHRYWSVCVATAATQTHHWPTRRYQLSSRG